MDGYIAEIRLWAGTFVPKYWAYCDGQTLKIQGYEALYSLIGNQYGGNGMTEFCLPKLAAPVPQNGTNTTLRYIICTQGEYPQRA